MVRSETLEHRGEVHLRIQAATLADVLAEAARALGELERQSIPVDGRTGRHDVTLSAPEVVSLLVDWLNELVYLAETTRWVPEQAAIHRADEQELHATVTGPHLMSPPSLVKAATLHGAQVRRTSDGWLAEVVLDV